MIIRHESEDSRQRKPEKLKFAHLKGFVKTQYSNLRSKQLWFLLN